MISLILSESALELVPYELENHPSVVSHARRLGKNPFEILLDNSWHFAAMKGIQNEMKRGRPDLVHFSILEATTIPLYLQNKMKLYIHTIDDKVISFGENVHIPKSYHRFAGVMEKLYRERKITSGNGDVLLTIEDKTFSELLDDINPSKIVGFSTNGKKNTYEEIATEISDGACVVFGGFQKGHFSDTIQDKITDLYSVGDESFEGHVVIARMLYEYEKTIFPLHDYQIKHDQTILLYSMISETLGNPKRPKKGFIEKPKFRQALREIKDDVRHTKVKLTYVLENFKTNTIHHERNYQFINKIDEPLYSLMNGIMTNNASSFNELKLSVFDKNQQNMKIIGINVDTDHSKEFTFKLNEPIFSGESGEYTISYNTPESHKNLENYFFIDSDDLDVSFEFETQHGLEPKVYYKKNNENEITLECTTKRKKSTTHVLWTKKEVHSGYSMRLEW